MSRLMLLLALLAPASAAAGECRWSKDGAWFVVTDDDMAEFGSPTTVTVYEARSGSVERTFTLRSELESEGEQAAADETAALEQWTAAHALVTVEPAAKSPDGKGKVAVDKVFKGGKGAWDGDTWRSTLQAHAVMTVERDGKKVISARWNSAFWGIDAYFDPTGRRVAWQVTSSQPMFRSPASFEYLLGPANPPRIQLMAVKAILPEVVKVVGARLEKAGFTPAQSLAAQSERTESEVFAAKGFEALAQKVAAAVPGGAKVSALTWKADADVVVAAGTKALGR